MLMMLAFRPFRVATGGSADAHDAGFQAVEWPQEGRADAHGWLSGHMRVG